MYWPLTNKRMADLKKQLDLQSSKKTNKECLGTKFIPDELDKAVISHTSEHLPYADEDQHEMTFMYLNKDIMPEAAKKYISTSIKLAHGS